MSYPFFSVLPRQAISLDGPTIAPPEGSVPDFDNPPNGNSVAIAIITVCVVVSSMLFLLRFYAKFLTKKPNASDYLTAVAFPLFWVYVWFSYRLSWTSGYLVNMWNIRLKDISAFSYVCWVATLLYVTIIALIKCAILLEWINIFVPKGKRNYFTWTCWATCAAICTLSLTLFIMDMVNCTPFEANWDILAPGYNCRFNVPKFALASAATNLALDLVPLVLAQKVIWSLQMSFRNKFGVSVIFLIGIIGCICGIVRLYYSIRFTGSNDVSYYFSIVALCSLCETTCAILILCAPFAPKAILGVKQTKSFSRLKEYMSLRSNPTYKNGSDAFRDASLTRGTKPEPTKHDHWVMMSSRGTDNETVYSEDSSRPFKRPEIV